jgi:hypothetical protein
VQFLAGKLAKWLSLKGILYINDDGISLLNDRGLY